MAIKLKLKDNVEVHTLEELRGNFDCEKIFDAFKSGRLIAWLADRFYDDEAEALANIDIDDNNALEKICAALNVNCDLAFADRLREKTAALAAMTDDKNIIDNAAATALNQEELAELIRMGCKTIYLCGENFSVPVRVAGMKYIGVLTAPKIKIRANSQADLAAQNITFENVQLPWQKSPPIDELKALAEKIFQTGGKWRIVKDGKQISTFDALTTAEQSAALQMVCHGEYTAEQIIFLQLTDDLTSGFALTADSFCTGGGIGSSLMPYKEILQTSLYAKLYFNNPDACAALIDADYDNIRAFLDGAKNF